MLECYGESDDDRFDALTAAKLFLQRPLPSIKVILRDKRYSNRRNGEKKPMSGRKQSRRGWVCLKTVTRISKVWLYSFTHDPTVSNVPDL
ncbi:hypothetical protein T4A_12536 [Trichinella pseudospiralis]|uniref:Uncharacterized protein n=1 Tax=Trichinella pseudospiralis TaxID=6337 RepID=A0A0V1EM69_TRIPS|nr:hypothetical protein T4A_12536 [Trichinella pseudospiralis]